MLPTSRVVSALLLGVGVAGLSAGLAAPSFIEAEPTLPLDLEHTTWTMTDENATTRLLQDGRQLQVPVTAQWHIALQEPADDEQVTLRVGSSWMRSSLQEEKDRLITAQVWSYPSDRLTGDALADAAVSHTMATPVSTVPVTGLWWKFPAGAEKTSYDVFDETLRDSAPAVFEEEMEMDGRTVYRYHQDIEPTNVAKKYNTYQTMLSGEDGTEYLFHSAQRDFYVDKVSGMIVDLDVSIKDFYAKDDGVETQNALTFNSSISEEDTQAFLEQTKKFHHTNLIHWIRWGLLGAGALITLIALLGIFGVFGTRSPEQPKPAAAPAAE